MIKYWFKWFKNFNNLSGLNLLEMYIWIVFKNIGKMTFLESSQLVELFGTRQEDFKRLFALKPFKFQTKFQLFFNFLSALSSTSSSCCSGLWFCWPITFWNSASNTSGPSGSSSEVFTIHSNIRDWWVVNKSNIW